MRKDNCSEIGALDKDGVKDKNLAMHVKKDIRNNTSPKYKNVSKCKNCQNSNGDIHTTSECSI